MASHFRFPSEQPREKFSFAKARKQMREGMALTWHTVKLVWKSSPVATSVLAALTLISSVLPLGVAYAGKGICRRGGGDQRQGDDALGITRDPNRLPARPTHPGEVLLEEFLVPLGITQARFAAHLKTSVQRINEIIKGKRSVTAETAWLLSEALGTTPQFWINLQATFDLVTQRPARHVKPIKNAS